MKDLKFQKLVPFNMQTSPWRINVDHTLRKVPRCHDKESIVVTKTIENVNGEPITRDLFSLDADGNIKITCESQLADQVYYADNDKRIVLLDALRRGVEDQYDECPPHGIDKEIIEDIEKIITKLKRR